LIPFLILRSFSTKVLHCGSFLVSSLIISLLISLLTHHLFLSGPLWEQC